MKEVEITCTCRSLKLPDLGLSLVKGEVAHISGAKASGSADLRRAVQMSGVTARTVERFQTRAVHVNHAPAPTLEVSPPPPPVPTEPSATDIINRTNAFLSAELKRTQEALRESLKQDIREVLVETVKELPTQQVVLTQSAPTVDGKPVALVAEPEERFIPSKVVPDLKVDAGATKATKAKSGGVDAASKALRAVKGKKKASSASKPTTRRRKATTTK